MMTSREIAIRAEMLKRLDPRWEALVASMTTTVVAALMREAGRDRS